MCGFLHRTSTSDNTYGRLLGTAYIYAHCILRMAISGLLASTKLGTAHNFSSRTQYIWWSLCPCIYSHARWELPTVTQVYVVFVWRPSSPSLLTPWSVDLAAGVNCYVLTVSFFYGCLPCLVKPASNCTTLPIPAKVRKVTVLKTCVQCGSVGRVATLRNVNR